MSRREIRGIGKGNSLKKPIYVTKNCKIEVVYECPPNNRGYVRCGIRPHPFFRGQTVYRARVVMSDYLRRALLTTEHVHHGKLGTGCDKISNLELLTSKDHNKHHKIGTKHSNESRTKISESLMIAYAMGVRKVTYRNKRDQKGRFIA